MTEKTDECSFCLSPSNKIFIDLACGHPLCEICYENLVDKATKTIICPLDLVITDDSDLEKLKNAKIVAGENLAYCAQCTKKAGESWFCSDCGLTLCSCAMKNHRFHACNTLNVHLVENFTRQKEKFRRLFERDLEIFGANFVKAFKLRLEPLKNVLENLRLDLTVEQNLKTIVFSKMQISDEKIWDFDSKLIDNPVFIEKLIDFCLSKVDLVNEMENLKVNDSGQNTPTESSAPSPSAEENLSTAPNPAPVPKVIQQISSYSAAAKLPAPKAEKNSSSTQLSPIFDASRYLSFQWFNYCNQKVCGKADLFAVAGRGVLYVDCRFLILYDQNLENKILRGWGNPGNELNPHTNFVLHHLPSKTLLVIHKGPRDDFLNDEFNQLSADDLSIVFTFKNDRNFQRHLFPQLTNSRYFSLQLLTDNRILLLVNYKNDRAKIFVSDAKDLRRLFENFTCIWQNSNFPDTFQQVTSARGQDIYAVGSKYVYHFHIKPKTKNLTQIRRLPLIDNLPIVSYRGFLYRFDTCIQIYHFESIDPSRIHRICWSRKDERIYVFYNDGAKREQIFVAEIKSLQ